MKKSLVTIAVLLSATISACGSQPSASTSSPQGTRLMGGEALPSANYFEQFLFKAEGDCTEIRTVQFRAFSTHETASLGEDDQGRSLFASVLLNLLADGTYWGEYSEQALLGVEGNSVNYEVVFSREIRGNWQVRGDRLIVENLGEGVAISHNQLAKVKFTFTRSLNDSRLSGRTSIQGRSTTNTGPRGESIRTFCKLPEE